MAAIMTKTPAGEDIVILPRAEYDALVARREEGEDAEAARAVIGRIDAGAEPVLSAAELDAFLAAPTPLAFWRKHRGLTQAALSVQTGIAQGFLSEIETGRKTGDVGTLRKIARALGIGLDDLVPVE